MVENGSGGAGVSRAVLIVIGVGGYVAFVCEVIFLLSMKGGDSRDSLLCLLSVIACMTGAAVYAWLRRSVAPEMCRKTLRSAFRGYILGATYVVAAATLMMVCGVIAVLL